MPSNTRDIKRRIKSVSNIKQITRAMQLVATSKMRRAQKKATDADPFAYGALEILENLTRIFQRTEEYPYWKTRKSNMVSLILITSDRGFCGGLNVVLLNSVLRFIKEQEALGYNVCAVTIGKKGRHFMRKLGKTLDADFSFGDHFPVQQVGPIGRIALTNFMQSAYRSVYIAYNQFVNTLVQKPTIRQILPFTIDAFKEIAEIDAKAEKFFFQNTRLSDQRAHYIFEPSAPKVLASLIPYLIEIEIYKALIESQASEHSARMVAMKNATDKSLELIDDLQLAYNQARQASITKEIAEISSGAMATR